MAYLPTSSIAPATVIPFRSKSSNASDTDFPLTDISVRMRRNEVPACEPRMPASASTPSIAVVCSSETPALAAIGATYFIDSVKLSSDSAVKLNESAITSTTRGICDASSRNPRNVAPATSADCARSSPVAVARSSVACVTAMISSGENPRRA